MDGLLFLVVAVVLYFAADRILQWLELRAGRRFEHRTLVFFALLMSFALVSFAAIRHFLPP